ncbi:MAG: biotin/lipoyl-binding protein, partial [Bacteroidales bacterium]
MDEKEENIVYSEPVNEIMGRPPGKVLRWGNAIMLLVFGLFFFFAWIIKYPDTIPAPVEITTVIPPVTLVSKISGRIKKLYVSDRENISKGQLIAVMETAASVDELN